MYDVRLTEAQAAILKTLHDTGIMVVDEHGRRCAIRLDNRKPTKPIRPTTIRKLEARGLIRIGAYGFSRSLWITAKGRQVYAERRR